MEIFWARFIYTKYFTLPNSQTGQVAINLINLINLITEVDQFEWLPCIINLINLSNPNNPGKAAINLQGIKFNQINQPLQPQFYSWTGDVVSRLIQRTQPLQPNQPWHNSQTYQMASNLTIPINLPNLSTIARRSKWPLYWFYVFNLTNRYKQYLLHTK